MKFEISVVIDQPVKRVFDFVTDLSNNTDWQTDILELEVTSEGRFGPGATYRCVNRFMGKHIESVGVITDYVPDQACSFQIISGSINGASNYFFETVNGATKLTTTAEFDLKLFKLGKRIVKHKIKTQMQKDITRLKKILENGKRG